jgi:hypothetical protein
VYNNIRIKRPPSGAFEARFDIALSKSLAPGYPKEAKKSHVSGWVKPSVLYKN